MLGSTILRALKRLFSPPKATETPRRTKAAARPEAKGPKAPLPSPPRAATESKGSAAPTAPSAPGGAASSPAAGLLSHPVYKHSALLTQLDGGGYLDQQLDERGAALLAEIGQCVEAGELSLPLLPATSVTAMDLSAHPSVEIAELVEAIATDPVMASELLKTANSALYGGHAPCETLHQAVVRMGLRAVRSMIFSISMRGVVLQGKSLSAYATEVWRQSHTVATIARAIARPLGFDADRAFLLGLLHDIGKVALLETIRRRAPANYEIKPALLGRAFGFHHEKAGAAVARAWKLPEEIVSVAGQHHWFAENPDHPRGAALVSLAHGLDLHFSLGYAAEGLDAMFEFLKVDPQGRAEMMATAKQAFEASLEQGHG